MAKQSYIYDGSGWEPLAAVSTDLTNYANMTTTPISGFRNAIINGDFSINQRGFTSTTTNNTYGFDRWFIQINGGGTTYSSQTFSPGNAISGYEPSKYARIVTTGQTASNVTSILRQPIEDVRTFAGQTITVSFWARSNSGTPNISFEFSQDFGTGGSSTVSTLAGKFAISTTWTRYSRTITLPSITGKTISDSDSKLLASIWVSAGTDFNLRTNSLGIQSNTFEIWGVQIEKGSIATPFEQRPIGTELALCQRYYYRSSAAATSDRLGLWGISHGSSNASVNGIAPVIMRAKPTLSFSNINLWTGTTNVTISSISVQRSTPTAFGADITISIAGTAGFPVQVTAGSSTAFWDANAEL
jgi:hypothetical protein